MPGEFANIRHSRNNSDLNRNIGRTLCGREVLTQSRPISKEIFHRERGEGPSTAATFFRTERKHHLEGHQLISLLGRGLLQIGGSNAFDQSTVQERLLDNPNMALFGAIDHGRTWVAGNENRRR
jgi:hypothetical protein